MRIATIGVYEFDAAHFIAALDEAGVTKVFDIRQRRGVRGAHCHQSFRPRPNRAT